MRLTIWIDDRSTTADLSNFLPLISPVAIGITALRPGYFHLAAWHNPVCAECCVNLYLGMRKLQMSRCMTFLYPRCPCRGHAIYILALVRLYLAHPHRLCRHGFSQKLYE